MTLSLHIMQAAEMYQQMIMQQQQQTQKQTARDRGLTQDTQETNIQTNRGLTQDTQETNIQTNIPTHIHAPARPSPRPSRSLYLFLPSSVLVTPLLPPSPLFGTPPPPPPCLFVNSLTLAQHSTGSGCCARVCANYLSLPLSLLYLSSFPSISLFLTFCLSCHERRYDMMTCQSA